jgi:hypothetical protein
MVRRVRVVRVCVMRVCVMRVCVMRVKQGSVWMRMVCGGHRQQGCQQADEADTTDRRDDCCFTNHGCG